MILDERELLQIDVVSAADEIEKIHVLNPLGLKLPKKYAGDPSRQVSMPLVISIKLAERPEPEPTRTV